MELNLLPVYVYLVGYLCASGSASPVLSIVPSTYNVGAQNLVSTIVPGGVVGSSQFLTTNPTVQSPIVQLVRQPGLVNVGGGVTQLLLPGQQQLLKGAGVVPYVTTNVPGAVHPTGVTTFNELGLTTGSASALPYTYANVNGVPVLISTAGLGLNGHQTAVTAFPQVGAPTSFLQPQTVVGVNPVRQVAEVEAVETPISSVVEVDPMDAALMDMENKGQMHMEKYAWGRSSLNNAKVTPSVTGTIVVEGDNSAKDVRANIPRVYGQLPTGSIVSSPPVVTAVPSSSVPGLTRNPFVDAAGKRKKHFEFYQYFRNLNPQEVIVPTAVVQPDTPIY